MTALTPSTLTDPIVRRTDELLRQHQLAIWVRIDRLFAGLLLFEWIVALTLALWRTPLSWRGSSSVIHPHVWTAGVLVPIIIALPIFLAAARPGQTLTRHVIATAQMLMSAVFTHLGDGRIEMHFHTFGSLAFLAFYRDWKVLMSASLIVIVDHLARGLLLPQSIYGVMSASVWRTLEHGVWVIFEDVFLIASCVQGVREMRGIAHQRALLEESHRCIERKVIERTAQLKATQDDLLRAARSAGMAEIATSVLHNVGNVLNSVNVSTSVVTDQLRKSETPTLVRLGNMVEGHRAELPQYLTADPQGRLIPDFLTEMGNCLTREQQVLLDEVSNIRSGVEHITRIVAAQQSMAKSPAVRTDIDPGSLMDSALLMQPASIDQRVTVVRDYQPGPMVSLDKHAVLQILINLVSNAVHAVGETASERQGRLELTVRREDGAVCFVVKDNGVGIPPENLRAIFSHGFTTKPTGHGFGLHASANSANSMGGSLAVESGGRGQGASFLLRLPVPAVSEVATC